MARTAAETASILFDLYDERFNRESSEPFRITWPQFRLLADLPRLSDSYLSGVAAELLKLDTILVVSDHFLAVIMDHDLSRFRKLPDRLLEKILINLEDIEVDEDEVREDEETEETDEDGEDENDEDITA